MHQFRFTNVSILENLFDFQRILLLEAYSDQIGPRYHFQWHRIWKCVNILKRGRIVRRIVVLKETVEHLGSGRKCADSSHIYSVIALLIRSGESAARFED